MQQVEIHELETHLVYTLHPITSTVTETHVKAEALLEAGRTQDDATSCRMRNVRHSRHDHVHKQQKQTLSLKQGQRSPGCAEAITEASAALPRLRPRSYFFPGGEEPCCLGGAAACTTASLPPVSGPEYLRWISAECIVLRELAHRFTVVSGLF